MPRHASRSPTEISANRQRPSRHPSRPRTVSLCHPCHSLRRVESLDTRLRCRDLGALADALSSQRPARSLSVCICRGLMGLASIQPGASPSACSSLVRTPSLHPMPIQERRGAGGAGTKEVRMQHFPRC
ncbi:hypothetical protein OE88DRAFT_205444 [Heliocybe sulcata]|uniref:Uncharacterized protein n=1 Tax=Heliocybe sulcata TaxID=5364 RepID=A0A5C3N1U4_9AGAM|nr:hypothetical protein OE88DRAFT_205444 [Heliocybe sulcata]